MVRLIFKKSILSSLYFLLFTQCFVNAATAATLSGVIYGDSAVLPGATVQLFSDNMTPISETQSGADGGYSFSSLGFDNYRLRVIAPSDSVFGNSPIELIEINNDDTQHNVSLVSSAFELTGVVQDLQGNLYQGIEVQLQKHNGTSWVQVGESIRTGEDGMYNWSVSPGIYHLYARKSQGASGLNYRINVSTYDFTVSGAITKNIDLPFVTLSGNTIDNDQFPIANVGLETGIAWQGARENSENGLLGASYHLRHYRAVSKSDELGSYAIKLFSSEFCRQTRANVNQNCNYAITTVPDSTSENVAQTTHESISVSNDMALDLELDTAFRLTGSIRDLQGNVYQGIEVQLQSYNGASWVQVGDTFRTGEDGMYNWSVSPGIYHLYARKSQGSAGLDYRINVTTSDFTVSGNMVKNIDLPFVTLSGKTVDRMDNAIGNVGIETGLSWQSAKSDGDNNLLGSSYFIRHYRSVTRSDESGNYDVKLFSSDMCLQNRANVNQKCHYSITAIPSVENQSVAQTIQSDLLVSNDMNVNLFLDSSYQLTGVIQDLQGNVYQGIEVQLQSYNGASWVQVGDTIRTGEGGSYNWSVNPGIYHLYARKSQGAAGLDYRINVSTSDFTVSGNLVKNIDLPFVTLSGVTLDSNGVSVPNVSLEAGVAWQESRGNGENDLLGASYHVRQYRAVKQSDQSGNYSIRLFSSEFCGNTRAHDNQNCDYDLTIIPPSDSGFAQVTNPGITVNDDMTQTIVLTHADTSAPTILTGPIVTSVSSTTASIEWTTDEPTTGSLLVNGVTYNRDSLNTYHSVFVRNLNSDTAYTASLTVSDRSGNQSQPASVDFRTTNQSDDSMPKFKKQPSIVNASNNSLTLDWLSSEPVSAIVNITSPNGSTQQVTISALKAHHMVTLNDLNSDTQYSMSVLITDAEGNGPVQSSSVVASTLSLPDSKPPVILTEPLVSEITNNSALVTWTTNEPTIGGLSANDGSQYIVQKVGEFSTHHSVRLMSLNSDTTYNFRVSVSDLAGNGPVLSDEKRFTTLAAENVVPPVFTRAARVLGVTHQSAIVQWHTNISTQGAIYYGLANNSLNQHKSSARLRKNHVLMMDDLQPNTTYFVRAKSISGDNKITSEILTFTTLSKADKVAPSIMGMPNMKHICADGGLLELTTDEDTEVQFELIQQGAESQYIHQSLTGKNHAVHLNGLIAGQSTDVKITVIDASGNADSQTIPSVFTTSEQPDNTAPDLLEAVSVANQSNDRVKLIWQADEPVYYSLQYFVKDSAQLINAISTNTYSEDGEVIVAGLDGGTSYDWLLTLHDMSGNSNTITGSFSTASLPDTTPPSLEQLSVGLPTSASAHQDVELTWQCTELCESYVQFGTDSDHLNQYASVQSADRSLSADLNGLNHSSQYFYQITTRDASGNIGKSSIQSFQTLAYLPDSDGDGYHDLIDRFPNDATEHADFDADGIGDNRDEDDDNDGVKDIDDADPNNPIIGSIDSTDTEPPVFDELPVVEINARGPLTPLRLPQVFANDNVDGEVKAKPSSRRALKPGRHDIVWTAKDKAGNQSSATQTLLIHPRVHFGPAIIATEGQRVQIPVVMDGTAARYPVTLDLILSGTASEEDYQVVSGDQTITIEEGTEGVFELDILVDSTFDVGETIKLTIDSATNASVKNNQSQVIVINETAPIPVVKWQVEQDNRNTRRISTALGLVDVSVRPKTPAHAQLQYDWSETDAELVNIASNTANNIFTFDPQLLETGVYTIVLTLYDSLSIEGVSRHELTLKVVGNTANANRLIDSDDDGIPDADDQHEAAHVIQASTSSDSSNNAVMTTEPGLRMTLGKRALNCDCSAAAITWDDIVTEFGFNQQSGSQPMTEEGDETLTMSSEIFDFQVHDLPSAGGSINIILPVVEGIPASGGYYKLTDQGQWKAFVEDENNSLSSASFVDGVCPEPSDSAYTTGLTEGDTCVQLTIEDGGPNDDDRTKNGVIEDPGVIAAAQVATVETVENTGSGSDQIETVDSGTSSGVAESGSAGSMNMYFIWLLLGLAIMRRVRVNGAVV